MTDFPSHPVRSYDRTLRASIGCTIYGSLLYIIPFYVCILVILKSRSRQAFIMKCKPATYCLFSCSGDEVTMLNDSWMVLLWSSDLCPWLSDAAASRFLIGILPASLYIIGENNNNLTLAGASQAIADSFLKLINHGLKVRDFASRGAATALGLNSQQFF